MQGESFQGSSYAAGVPDQFNFLIAKVACLGAVPTGGPSVTMQQGFCFMSLQLSSPLYSLQSCLCSHASAVTPLQSCLCSHASAVTPLPSCLCSHASAVTPLQSCLCSHASAVMPLQSCLCSHASAVTPLQSCLCSHPRLCICCWHLYTLCKPKQSSAFMSRLHHHTVRLPHSKWHLYTLCKLKAVQCITPAQ